MLANWRRASTRTSGVPPSPRVMVWAHKVPGGLHPLAKHGQQFEI